eukprot:sb/3472820/
MRKVEEIERACDGDDAGPSGASLPVIVEQHEEGRNQVVAIEEMVARQEQSVAREQQEERRVAREEQQPLSVAREEQEVVSEQQDEETETHHGTVVRQQYNNDDVSGSGSQEEEAHQTEEVSIEGEVNCSEGEEELGHVSVSRATRNLGDCHSFALHQITI